MFSNWLNRKNNKVRYKENRTGKLMTYIAKKIFYISVCFLNIYLSFLFNLIKLILFLKPRFSAVF